MITINGDTKEIIENPDLDKGYVHQTTWVFDENEGPIDVNVYYFYKEGQKEKLDELNKEAKVLNEAIESLPSYQKDADEAICELYEQTLTQQNIINQQDEAICELYEMIGGDV